LADILPEATDDSFALDGSIFSGLKEVSEITGHVLITNLFIIVFVTPHEQCQNTESIQQYSTTWFTK